jgi:hypothetical protein
MGAVDRRGGWGIGALCGFLGFALVVVGLHVARPDLSAATVAVSYYVHGPYGGWLTVGLTSLGLGSLALALLLRRTLHARGAVFVQGGVGLWGVCVLLAAVFPADPMGRWTEPPSAAGLIHGVAALIGFLALPLAALALARGLRDDQDWGEAGAHLVPLGILCAVSLLAFLTSLWPTLGANRPPVLLGLTERVLLAANLAWLMTSALRGLRIAGTLT